MGWFSKSEAKVFDKWRVLNSIEQVDALIKQSQEYPVVILKHSTSCGVSRMVMNGLTRDWDLTEDELHFYYLDLLQHRDISNLLAQRSGVRHESPQVLMFKNGVAIYNASHSGVTVRGLREGLK